MTVTPEELKAIVSDVLEEKFSKFFVPPEQHYNEHQIIKDLFVDADKQKIKDFEARNAFIDTIMAWTTSTKNKVYTSLTMLVVLFIIGLITLGFWHYLRDGLTALGMTAGGWIDVRKD